MLCKYANGKTLRKVWSAKSSCLRHFAGKYPVKRRSKLKAKSEYSFGQDRCPKAKHSFMGLRPILSRFARIILTKRLVFVAEIKILSKVGLAWALKVCVFPLSNRRWTLKKMFASTAKKLPNPGLCLEEATKHGFTDHFASLLRMDKLKKPLFLQYLGLYFCIYSLCFANYTLAYGDNVQQCFLSLIKVMIFCIHAWTFFEQVEYRSCFWTKPNVVFHGKFAQILILSSIHTLLKRNYIKQAASTANETLFKRLSL